MLKSTVTTRRAAADLSDEVCGAAEVKMLKEYNLIRRRHLIIEESDRLNCSMALSGSRFVIYSPSAGINLFSATTRQGIDYLIEYYKIGKCLRFNDKLTESAYLFSSSAASRSTWARG